ncbi:MAG: pyrroline-5-carboxylate reductase [Phycisphaerales bacterium]|nr:pyrroline-5-carboxylate reductase [Planctomycetota bacterium]MCH8508232.1 pyrroline-5-carboxylate reductase [Phycisphaerales bacterium]
MSTNHDAGGWLFIGAGNMGRAIAAGAVRAGAARTNQLAAVDPTAPEEPPFGRVMRAPEEAGGWLRDHPEAGVVVAVKPQMFAAVAGAWSPLLSLGPGRLVVSIMAGTTAAAVGRGMGEHTRVVRVMPNTPIGLGLGMSAACAGPNAGEGDMARVERLFGASGKVMRIDEGLMDAFTALAGSGPAYVFYLAEAMVEAAEQLGFDRERALTLVRQTVCGAGELLNHAPETPRALRAAVTSKGGTTAAATGVLDDAGVHDAVVRAVHAARHRGVELGQA